MKKIIFLMVVTLTTVMNSCFYPGPCVHGSGPVYSEERNLGEFYEVKNTESFEVRVSRADSFSVVVDAQENLLAVIETYISGSELIIKTRNGICIEKGSQVVVYVTTPLLEGLSLSGSGRLIADVADCLDFECRNSGSGYVSIDSLFADVAYIRNTGSGEIYMGGSYVNEVEISQSGSGSIEAGIIHGTDQAVIGQSSSGRIFASVPEGHIVNVDLTGSGRIELSGDAADAEYRLTSSGKIDALELVAEDVTAKNTGSGRIFLYASQTLDVNITGSGNIYYLGDPAINKRITGSGKLHPYN